jgi:3-hydroxyacyl-CoA dehydrogenase
MTTAAAEITEQAIKPAPNAEPMLVRSAAVLGAGTMGSRIAAHLANCGIPVLLLDIVPEGAEKSRNKLASSAIEALLKAKPAAFYEPNLASLVTPGNFEDDLPKLLGCDWVIEAVTENLEVKKSLLTRVLPHVGPRAILTTNTSGLPISQIARSLGDAFTPSLSKRWFGTHFFNPPRYMRLLEVIPTVGYCPVSCCRILVLRRPHSRQAGCPGARHTQLHRQPHRHIQHVRRAHPDAAAGIDR